MHTPARVCTAIRLSPHTAARPHPDKTDRICMLPLAEGSYKISSRSPDSHRPTRSLPARVMRSGGSLSSVSQLLEQSRIRTGFPFKPFCTAVLYLLSLLCRFRLRLSIMNPITGGPGRMEGEQCPRGSDDAVRRKAKTRELTESKLPDLRQTQSIFSNVVFLHFGHGGIVSESLSSVTSVPQRRHL